MKESIMESESEAKLEYTGERLVPECARDDLIFFEHYSRYIFASQFVKDKIVLDIACGVGYGSELLLTKGARQVIGVDMDPATISYAKRNYQREGIEFILGDAQKISLADNSIDVVVSFETIEHLNDFEQFLSEIHRVLSSQGSCIISTPNIEEFPGNQFHTKEFGIEEFKNVLSKHFKDVEIYYQNNMLASSISTRSFLDQDQLEEEYKIRTYRCGKIDLNESMFVLAVCSDSAIPKFEENILIDSGKELKKLQSDIKELDATCREAVDQKGKLEEKNMLLSRELHEALCEIDRIHASASWRLSKPVRVVKPGVHRLMKPFRNSGNAAQ